MGQTIRIIARTYMGIICVRARDIHHREDRHDRQWSFIEGMMEDDDITPEAAAGRILRQVTDLEAHPGSFTPVKTSSQDPVLYYSCFIESSTKIILALSRLGPTCLELNEIPYYPAVAGRCLTKPSRNFLKKHRHLATKPTGNYL
jgi:hypothetical protein